MKRTSEIEGFSRWRKYRIAIAFLALVIATGLWWLFRPERLFINQQVSEMAPAGVAAIQPVFTGSLHAADAAEIQGRVNILKTSNGLQLQIANLESKAAASFSVALAPTAESTSEEKNLGTITVAGDKKLPIPPGLDPGSYRTVLLLDQSHRVIAKALLEPF